MTQQRCSSGVQAAHKAGAAAAAGALTPQADMKQAAGRTPRVLQRAAGPSPVWSPRGRSLRRHPPLQENASPTQVIASPVHVRTLLCAEKGGTGWRVGAAFCPSGKCRSSYNHYAATARFGVQFACWLLRLADFDAPILHGV